MSDLISRSDLIKEIDKYCGNQSYLVSENVREIIKNQPTAYSVDKVVEELEKRKQEYLVGFGIHDNNEMYGIACGLGDAIEIVKQGGISDDVCEWKYINDFELTSDNHESKCIERCNYKYCPYCGKKIRMVE